MKARNDSTSTVRAGTVRNRPDAGLRTPRGAFALAVGSLLLIAAGVALDLWMLTLPSQARTPCSGSPDILTYVTADGIYCEGPNSLIQPWLGLLVAAVGVGCLVMSWRFERRVGWILHRGTTGLAHASVLATLGLPFLVFTSGSCGLSADVSGYQVLTGFDLPSFESLVTSGPVRHIGPNPAIAILILAALIGVGASGWRSRRSDLLRLGTAAAGIAGVFAAFLYVPSSIHEGSVQFRFDAGWGSGVIGLALAVSFVVDGQAVVRWRASARRRAGPGPAL